MQGTFCNNDLKGKRDSRDLFLLFESAAKS